MERRSMMEPAVSLLNHAPGAGSTSESRPRNHSSIASMASFLSRLYRSMARLFATIASSGTSVRRARSSSSQSRQL